MTPFVAAYSAVLATDAHVPSAVSAPSPSIRSILFFLNSPRDAAGQRLDDLLAARLHAAKSTSSAGDRDAELAGLAISLSMSAERSTALAGMHA